MAAQHHEDQVDTARNMFAGHKTSIYDNGEDQVGRMNLLEERLQFFVEARAEIRRLKRSKALANFLLMNNRRCREAGVPAR
jgi:hypothetical protein